MIDLLSVYDEEYFESGRELSEQRIKRTLDLLGDVHGMSILDLGAGTGEGSVLLRERGADVTCLDVAPYAMRRCRSLNLDGVMTAGNTLPFTSQSFDGVLFMDVIEHLTKTASAQTLREIRRVTKPGGRIVIHTMPTVFLENMSQLYGLINRDHWRRWGTQGGHINTYTPWRLRKELRLSGLKIEEFTIGSYPHGAPFYKILRPVSGVLRPILGNDLWVCCTP